jgi:hypothetical protein
MKNEKPKKPKGPKKPKPLNTGQKLDEVLLRLIALEASLTQHRTQTEEPVQGAPKP